MFDKWSKCGIVGSGNAENASKYSLGESGLGLRKESKISFSYLL
jgi:hypothetical protein